MQTQMVTKLTEKVNNRVAWTQVNSSPTGAEIFVDDAATGKATPSQRGIADRNSLGHVEIGRLPAD